MRDKAAWCRDRTCIDCGKTESVRKDNKSERCVSCTCRRNASSPAAKAASRARVTAVTLTCAHCSASFTRAKSHASKAKETYCSRECKHRHRSVDRTCKCCGKDFRVARRTVTGTSNSSGNFCSRPCYERWLCRTERTTGRGSQWRKISSEVRARTPFCAHCGSLTKPLQVHHIVPFRLTHDNDNRNLIPLCTTCHKHIEHTTVEIEAAGVPPSDMFFALSIILRLRQAQTIHVLRRLRKANERAA